MGGIVHLLILRWRGESVQHWQTRRGSPGEAPSTLSRTGIVAGVTDVVLRSGVRSLHGHRRDFSRTASAAGFSHGLCPLSVRHRTSPLRSPRQRHLWRQGRPGAPPCHAVAKPRQTGLKTGHLIRREPCSYFGRPRQPLSPVSTGVVDKYARIPQSLRRIVGAVVGLVRTSIGPLLRRRGRSARQRRSLRQIFEVSGKQGHLPRGPPPGASAQQPPYTGLNAVAAGGPLHTPCVRPRSRSRLARPLGRRLRYPGQSALQRRLLVRGQPRPCAWLVGKGVRAPRAPPGGGRQLPVAPERGDEAAGIPATPAARVSNVRGDLRQRNLRQRRASEVGRDSKRASSISSHRLFASFSFLSSPAPYRPTLRRQAVAADPSSTAAAIQRGQQSRRACVGRGSPRGPGPRRIGYGAGRTQRRRTRRRAMR